MICNICPRRCGAERTETYGGGFCRMPAVPVIARAGLHLWEEPVLSGTRGSGAVFFSGCSLGCVYCQNHTISAEGVGKAVTTERLREIFRELIAQGAHNIDLITASHFVPFLLPALEEPLPVPVVFNCGGYERVETLRLLEGKVQIWLPDLKYGLEEPAGAIPTPRTTSPCPRRPSGRCSVRWVPAAWRMACCGRGWSSGIWCCRASWRAPGGSSTGWPGPSVRERCCSPS